MKYPEADPEELQKLTEVYKALGMSNPDIGARMELEEKSPQLALFCLTKGFWQGIVKETDDSWIDGSINSAKRSPNDSGSQAGIALQEMLDKGVSRAAITDLIRVMQYEAVEYACAILDGVISIELPIEISPNVAIHQMDNCDRCIRTVDGLHEVFLSNDPTGREMRPRERA